MKRPLAHTIPVAVKLSLEKLGGDIRIARLKRGLTAQQVALSLGAHRTTYGRLERGDPMVALGLYASALFVLGIGATFATLADPRHDQEGLQRDLQRLPRRANGRPARAPRFALQSLASRSGKAARRGDLLRIGVLGVMSGPAGFWGTVNKACAQVTADMYNEAGGVDIGGRRYEVEIVCVDDRLDPQAAAEGARHLTEKEGIRYIIGPNVSQTFIAALPVVEKNRAMLFPYSFTRDLYQAPRENAVLVQVAGYQAAPLIYRHLIEHEGVETLSIVAPSTPEGLRQRQDLCAIAAAAGLRVLSDKGIYRVGADHLEATIPAAIAGRPDVLALPNAAPADAARLIRQARALGFRGYITTESAQDVEGLIRSLGPAADGLIVVGGASSPDMRSARMNDFVRRFTAIAGTWNDEAGTKAYALEFILATLQTAGQAAVDDIDRFKSAIPSFCTDDPFVRGRSSLAYYGTRQFRQKRQIGIPLVVNTIRDGRLQTLFTQRADEILA